MAGSGKKFWEDKSLSDLSQHEWESLCDGCAKCCLYKLEDYGTREVFYTNVHCRLLNVTTGRCTDYPNRSTRVPDCVAITPEVLEDPYWLPKTCAYRLVAEGSDLPEWHPLRSGVRSSVIAAGHCICGRTVCEDEADALEQHLITWVT